MNILYELKCPEDVEATITIKATVKEFTRLKEILDNNPGPQCYPHGYLRNAISTVIRASSARFEQEATDILNNLGLKVKDPVSA